jgi:hypothetical protein
MCGKSVENFANVHVQPSLDVSYFKAEILNESFYTTITLVATLW